jgi:hypothetical protein
VAKLAFWFECGSQNDCVAGTLCVNWQGAGYCVPATDPDFGCGPDQTRTLPVFGGDGQAVVCVSKGPRCGSDGVCFAGCASFGCEGELTCNDVTGLCECSGNDDCTDSGVCGADHLCAECATSADCEGRDDGNEVCFDGKCGCGSAATCPNYGWVAATPVCE